MKSKRIIKALNLGVLNLKFLKEMRYSLKMMKI